MDRAKRNVSHRNISISIWYFSASSTQYTVCMPPGHPFDDLDTGKSKVNRSTPNYIITPERLNIDLLTYLLTDYNR